MASPPTHRYGDSAMTAMWLALVITLTVLALLAEVLTSRR